MNIKFLTSQISVTTPFNNVEKVVSTTRYEHSTVYIKDPELLVIVGNQDTIDLSETNGKYMLEIDSGLIIILFE